MGLLNTNKVTLTAPVDEDAGPPVFWWMNGNKAAKTSGAFYVKADALPEDPGAPWAADDRFDGETGLSATALRIAYICHRAQAFTEEKINGRKYRTWHTHWLPGQQMRIQTEILCFVEGMGFSPMILSVKGMTGKAFTARQSSIMAAYRAGLLREGSRIEGAKLPPWAFWLPIAAQADGAGKPVYTPTGHDSFVTLPALHINDTSEQTIVGLFVGLDLLQAGDDLRKEYDGWMKAQRGNVTIATSPVASVASEPGWDDSDEDIIPF